jgi:uncharacterized damage-inducible protein DinB
MRIVDAILSEFEQETVTTRRVLERVPEDKFDWKPHAKSMSLGQLALHIAQVPGAIAGFVSAPTLALSAPFTQPPATSIDEVLAGLDKSVAKVHDILGGMDDDTATSTWTLTAGGKTLMSVRRLDIIRSLMLNHWYHHRGQLSVYLRELEVPLPSIYGPSADENPFDR